jgi:hypothetical protein
LHDCRQHQPQKWSKPFLIIHCIFRTCLSVMLDGGINVWWCTF